jgi:pimeloyl-ACP methyl ester carboxylesterase
VALLNSFGPQAADNGTAGQVDTSSHTERLTVVNGVSLHHLDWGGTGEPLVFLTGYGSPAHVFDRFAPHFTDRFHVVALTRRGRAPSQAPPSGYDLETLTADVRGLLDALGFRRVHLVAHSFGGAEATRLATLYRDRVASVVYMDAALDGAASEAVMKESPIPNPRPSPGTPYAQVLRWWASYTPDFTGVACPALAFYAVQSNPPVPPTVGEPLRQRAHEFWQTKWLPMVRSTIEKFTREAPRARVVILEDASHALFEDREAAVLREMKDFYAGVR